MGESGIKSPAILQWDNDITALVFRELQVSDVFFVGKKNKEKKTSIITNTCKTPLSGAKGLGKFVITGISYLISRSCFIF